MRLILALLFPFFALASSSPIIWGPGKAVNLLPLLCFPDGSCLSGGSGTGSVTSVALADGSAVPIFLISGSPVTTNGTLTFTLTDQVANTVFAGPATGVDSEPTFRALTSDDIPDLTSSKISDFQTSVSANTDVAANTAVRHDAVTLGTANGLSLSTQALSLQAADATHTGALTSSDWGAFNSKQDAGNFITALTGDATAAGPGSVAVTFATVNSNVGSFGSSTSIPSFTVNAKGLVTAASGNVVIAPAGTLTGTTLASNVVTSSITTVGVIAVGTWQGTKLDFPYGGTNATTANGALNNLLPGQTGNSGKVLTTDGSGTTTWTSFQSPITTGNLTAAGTDGIAVTSGTGAVIGSGTSLAQHVSDSTHNGYLSSTDWSTFNGKQSSLSFTSPLVNTSGTVTCNVASGSQAGCLASADWTTFNSKQNALTIGNLTDAGTDGITVTSGTGAVIGSGTSLSQHIADSTHNGYLSSTDWGTFNGKQSALTFTAPLVNTTGTVSCNSASGSQAGCLSSTDWTTFNNKVSSPWAISGSNISYTAGSVGIGTTAISAFKLFVTGSTANSVALFTNPSNNAQIAVSSGTATASLEFLDVTDDSFVSTLNGDLNFSTGGSTRMTIQRGGPVGIGTTAPGALLEVHGGQIYISSNASPLFSVTSGGTPLSEIQIGNTDYLDLGDFTTYPGIRFFPGASTPSVVMLSSGKVGIGTVAPTAVLHLKAGTAAANTAPIKFTSGVNLTTPEDGALEYNGTNLSFTIGSTRSTIRLGSVDLTSQVTGILPVTNGGTGTATGSITGTGALVFTAGGTDNNVQLSPVGTGFAAVAGNMTVSGSGSVASLQNVSDMNVFHTGGSTATAGGALTLGRNDTTVANGDTIGVLQFWNNDATLTTQNIYGTIEMQAAQAINIDAAVGNMIFKTTDNTVAGAPAERMRITSTGHVAYSGDATPTVGTCGTTPAITGNDVRGVVTVGTGVVTACTVTFGNTWSSAPFCFIEDLGTAAAAVSTSISARSTTAFTISFGASFPGGQVLYHCMN